MIAGRAVTRRLDAVHDLLAEAGEDGYLFERAGTGMAARGMNARVPLADVPALLTRFEVDDDVQRPGTGAVAVAAVPFLPDAGCEAVIPRVVVGRDDDGTAWVTTIVPEGGAGEPPVPLASGPDPVAFTVESDTDPDTWCDAVVAATKEIGGGRLDKVVLARSVSVRTDRPVPRAAVLRRLRTSYRGCYVYGVEGFVGASPELLVERRGDVVRAHPMAGTVPRTGDPSTDARLVAGLLASAKMRNEHQITIDMVHDTLLPWCSYLDYEAEPSVVAVANVQHLATMVEGRLSRPPPSVLELVKALHPTPAVCGWPRHEALAVIGELETTARGRYAGAVGWVDAAGNGSWAVSIRCAELDGTTARLWAGNGIVADSDPQAELEETRAKFQALLGAIIRP